jgi:hypothetical protein
LAATIGITGFTQITGASFYDAPNSNIADSPTIDGITITPNPSFLNFSAAGGSPNPPDVPGDGGGFGSVAGGFGGVVPITLDFSQPVAAFGATFIHSGSGFSLPSPAEIQAFDGLNGTGTLLGTITDSGGNGTSEDFSGLWSSGLDIQSVIISSTPPDGGYAVDGYAISLIPLESQVPEPSALGLLVTGLALLLVVGRRRSARLDSCRRHAACGIAVLRTAVDKCWRVAIAERRDERRFGSDPRGGARRVAGFERQFGFGRDCQGLTVGSGSV